jgi:hypothetical protein
MTVCRFAQWIAGSAWLIVRLLKRAARAAA